MAIDTALEAFDADGGADVEKLEVLASRLNLSGKGDPQSDTNKTLKRVDIWGQLMLPGTVQAPPIPADILPSWAGEMAAAVAKDTQTPEAAAVSLALSMIAISVQRRFCVAPHGDGSYTEPLCLWVLAALASGSRKTSVLNALTYPHRRWEKLLADRLRPEIASTEATRRVAKKRIESLETQAAREKDANARENIRKEIQDEIEAMPDEMRPPRLFTGDVTPERLQEMMVEQHERMAVVSDEAGIFLILGGMYSGGQANLDTFLQAYSGSSVRVDRKGRTAYLEAPALSFGLALQPGVLADVANNKRFHDSGLLARFLFVIPQNTVGSRDVRARNPIPVAVSTAWHDGLHNLLKDAEKKPSEPKLLPFTNQARECWLDFAQKVEIELGVGGKLVHIAEWGAKLPGQCARIAGLIQMVTTGCQSERIEFDAVHRAVSLTGLLVKHAQAAFRLLGADQIEADAVVLMEWVRMRGLDEFDRSAAQKALEGRFRTVARLKDAAERLAEWNAISPELQRRNKGARATPYYRVNPALLGISPNPQ